MKQVRISKGALERAEAVRDIELDLYWRRAAYFWAFSAAAFGGYFTLATAGKSQPDLMMYVGCLGLIFSYVWYLANRGGKYWQVNWEHHIDMQEDRERGALYKTTLVIPRRDFWRPVAAYPFSVSKLNQWLSLFVCIVWLLLVVRSVILNNLGLKGEFTVMGFALVLTAVFLVLLTTMARRTRPSGDRSLDMETRTYEDKETPE